MPNFPRTDLAVEAEAIHRSAAAVTELPGVRAEETNRRGFSVTEVHVLDAAGENALCKPIGDYYTLALDPLLRREDDAFENAAQTLAELLRGVLPLMPDGSVLVVGLGNRAMRVEQLLLVDHHLEDAGRSRPTPSARTRSTASWSRATCASSCRSISDSSAPWPRSRPACSARRAWNPPI